jgi:hypothetical protein
MHKLKKINILVFLLIMSVLFVIPNLFINTQTNNQSSIDENSSIDNFVTQKLQESLVYYEDTTGNAYGVFIEGDYAYIAGNSSGLIIIDISDPTNPGTPVYEDTTGSSHGVFLSGDYAYIADGVSGLAVIDISDPTNPGTPIYEDTTGFAYDVFVSGDYAYVADGDSGLAIINISDPTNPGTAVYEDTTGQALDVCISGDYAYIADNSSGLAIIGIIDPTNPGTPVYEDTTGFSHGLYLSGDYAYIADGDSGLAVIDISNPISPGTPVYEDTTGYAYDVFVDGDYAYIADNSSGLAVIGIPDPINPETPLYEDITGDARGIYVSGNYAYMADDNFGLAVIVVSEPLDPEGLNYVGTTDTAYGVYISGNYAYVAASVSGLAIIDISDPTNPGTPVYEATTGAAFGVYISGGYAYVADYVSGLAIINVTDPTNPGTPIYVDTNGTAYDVYISGNYAYVADYDWGLAIINISDPTNPGKPVYEDTSGFARNLYVEGNYTYVADQNAGLAIINTTDPTNPGTPVYEDTFGISYGVDVSGDYAYLADGSLGLGVIDVSDPTNPGSPVYEDTQGIAFNVYVNGDYAYVASGDAGLAVIDISNPADPGTPIYRAMTGYANEVSVSGNYAYVADGALGLVIVDVSDPTNLGRMAYENTNGYSRDVYISGDYAYIADGSSGLAVIDISDPTNPGTPLYEDTANDASGICLSGDYAYVADGSSGLAIIDISNPINPGTPIYEDTNGTAYDVSISGNYAYVANGDEGLAIIDISDPTNPAFPIYEDTTGSARGVYISGDFAYIADYNSGLAIINISDPINPGIPFYKDTTGYAYNVYVSGDYAYLATGGSGLSVIDISDPTNPGTPIYEDTTGSARGVYISGDYAYIADDTYGLAVINIASPTNPGVPVSEDTIGNALDVYISGDFAFISDASSGLAITQVRERVDMENPIISNAPTDFTIEHGYTGQSISWTATDAHPDTYTIELQGTGIVAGPTAWTSGNAITYNIPNGFGVGSYIYIVNFTDENNHWITDSVNVTVEDTTDPVITVSPSNFTAEYGYTGQSISWTATDPYPDTYTIELQGTGIVAGPTAWTSGNAISYNIPDGFDVGSYIYIVNFIDDYSNTISDSVNFSVVDTTDPVITVSPSNFTAEYGYTGQSISWTATDIYPDTYTIELQGTGIVAGPTAWTSGNAITYNIPDGFDVGSYVYIVTFADDYSNFIKDSVRFTVEDSTVPVITISPSNFTVESGYTGQSISWTATDAHPDIYTIELLGMGIVAGPTAWTSGNAITYNIPDGLAVGPHVYIVNFMDLASNSVTDSVRFTVEDTISPIMTISPSNFTVEYGYTGQSISWTVTDLNPDTYTIELLGTGIVAGPTAWTSGNAITYNIPDGFGVGSYVYLITFTDLGSNSINDSVRFTVEDTTDPVISVSPNNFTVEFGYTSESLSWTATDPYPDTYIIELIGTGTVVGPTAWTSGVAINYNIPDGFEVGSYVYVVTFLDDYGNSITDSVNFSVEDTTDPIIAVSPNNFTVEYGYTGQSLSWTATDAHPNTYTVVLLGTGTVVGPTAWTSGNAVTYNIPDGFSLGSYIYVVTFTDDYSNFITDSVNFTVEDTTNPVITVSPSNFTVEYEYTGQSISWTATDANPNTYTIDLFGTGTVAGPTTWTSGSAITYNIPDGFSVGSYIYVVTFTDLGGNYITDSVNFTVEDTTNPVITVSPSNFTVEFGYNGQSLSWTATDPHPNTYTIELIGTGIVTGPTAWTSGVAINYNIPNGLSVGSYVYTVRFTDDYNNFITDSVNFTVEDTTSPVITVSPSNFTVEQGYTGESISWTAMDPHPNTYTIELIGTGIVAGPTAWTSGVAINYNIPDGFGAGSYVYTVRFIDDYSNFITHSVNFTVEDTTNPVITNSPSNFTVEQGYTGLSLVWTATDLNPDTYTIELLGTGIVAGPTAWTSGVAINYNIPDGWGVGSYVYIITFRDDFNNFILDRVNFSIEDTTAPAITITPNDLAVELGYTGQSISWTAVDGNPSTYTITLQGTGIVAGPIAWTSGNAIIYNIPDGFSIGSYIYIVNFTDNGGFSSTDSVVFSVEDTTSPFITISPSNFTVEFGYTGQNISWAATDANPDTYTIELLGTGIVLGPTAWTSGIAITYDIPNGFGLGSYVYIVNFSDDYGNFIIGSVKFTVEDTIDPVLTTTPNNITVEEGYTGQSLSWTATDPNPNTYTIELIGTGTVAGPTVWTSGVAINYNIPGGLGVGSYLYAVNFTDLGGNFITSSVNFTVTPDTVNPIIILSSDNITANAGYTALSISWTASDANPDTYTIELLGTGIVAGPTPWTSGNEITYDIPLGFDAGVYTYNITFIDIRGNSVSSVVSVTITKPPEGGIPLGNTFLLFIGLSVVCLLIAIKRKILKNPNNQ